MVQNLPDTDPHVLLRDQNKMAQKPLVFDGFASHFAGRFFIEVTGRLNLLPPRRDPFRFHLVCLTLNGGPRRGLGPLDPLKISIRKIGYRMRIQRSVATIPNRGRATLLEWRFTLRPGGEIEPFWLPNTAIN